MTRAATAADAPAILLLERACLGADAWSPAMVADALAGAAVCLVVGEPVHGYAVVSVAGDVADLQRIAVAADRRRHGVGAELLAAAARHARAAGADRLLLEVRDDNRAALAFYADAGFVEIDRRSRYYADGATAVVLRLPLVQGCGGHM